MGMADFILAGEGELYDINEYHMLAHLIINKVEDFGTFLAQSVHEDVVLYILVLQGSCGRRIRRPRTKKIGL